MGERGTRDSQVQATLVLRACGVAKTVGIQTIVPIAVETLDGYEAQVA